MCCPHHRNLPEERISQRTYYDIEKRCPLCELVPYLANLCAYRHLCARRGELLVAPDRADEWGEELTEIGKWQRTNVTFLADLFVLALSFPPFFAHSG